MHLSRLSEESEEKRKGTVRPSQRLTLSSILNALGPSKIVPSNVAKRRTTKEPEGSGWKIVARFDRSSQRAPEFASRSGTRSVIALPQSSAIFFFFLPATDRSFCLIGKVKTLKQQTILRIKNKRK